MKAVAVEGTAAPVRTQKIAGGGYEVFQATSVELRCAVSEEGKPSGCGDRCAIIGVMMASCTGEVGDLGISGDTAVLNLAPQQGGQVRGFGLWDTKNGVRVVERSGTAARTALRRDGKVTVVRKEGPQIVDYLVEEDAWLRRAWGVPRERAEEVVTTAAWSQDRLFARVSNEPSQAWSYQDISITNDNVTNKIDVSLPSSYWGSPWSQAREADGSWLSVARGSYGVGFFSGALGWALPISVTRDSSVQRALPGDGKVAVVSLVSFDTNDRSGVHVIVPSGPLPGGKKGTKIPVSALDLQILSSRAVRKDDCPRQGEPTPTARPCTRVEEHTEGLGMARVPADSRAWIAFFTRKSEHKATAQMGCKQPSCRPGQPCMQPACQLIERDVVDTTKIVLSLYRLSADNASLEKAAEIPMGQEGVPGEIGTLEMGAQNGYLYIVSRARTAGARLMTIDTTRLSPTPATPAEVAATKITLEPLEDK